jgi:hypothetical protein
MKKLTHALVSFMPFAVVITGLCLLVYITAQQMYRQGLNDPQIQMVKAAKRNLEKGADPQIVVSGANIEMSKDVDPWLAVYNLSRVPVASSGLFHGERPTMPEGLLSTDKYKNYQLYAFGEDRVTWEPSWDVRQALVIVTYDGGFLVAGRDTTEIDSRIDMMGWMVLVAWGCIMIATLVVQLFAQRFIRS